MSRNLLHRQRSECQEEKNFVSRVEEGRSIVERDGRKPNWRGEMRLCSK